MLITVLLYMNTMLLIKVFDASFNTARILLVPIVVAGTDGTTADAHPYLPKALTEYSQ